MAAIHIAQNRKAELTEEMDTSSHANSRGAFALVLDMSPTVWTSPDEFHFRLSKAYRERGIQPIIIFARTPPDDYARRMAASGAKIWALNFSEGKLRYFRALREIFRTYGVHTVQSRGFNYFISLWWLIRLCGVRRIIHVENNGGLLRARNWRRTLLNLRTIIVTWPLTRVVGISNFIKGQLSELKIPPAKLHAIHNGVDTTRYRPDQVARNQWREQFGLKPEEAVLTAIAYLRPIKQPQVMFEACGLLAKRRLPFRFLVAGTGSEVEKMKQLSRELGFADRVLWLGEVSQTERLLQASDLLLLSTVGEAFGNVLIEAMACGVPCIATASGGIPEVVAHGETGLLTAPYDSTGFADAIEKLLRDEPLRKLMAEQAVARTRRMFDVDLTVRNFVALYDTLAPLPR